MSSQLSYNQVNESIKMNGNDFLKGRKYGLINSSKTKLK